MTMTEWRLKPLEIDEREEDYSAHFLCTNLSTGEQVTVTLQQKKKRPARDLIGACRALAQLLENAASGEDEPPATGVGRLN